MSSHEEARRVLEEAMKQSGVNPFADVASAFGQADADEFRKQVTDRVAGRVRDTYSLTAIGDVFKSLADEARAIRLRMENA